MLSYKRPPRENVYTPESNLPRVSVIMAAHNEAAVIGNKIDSVFNTNYPLDKLELLVGSDCSTDATNAIVNAKKDEYKSITFMEFNTRQGKANTMNQLLDRATGDIIISTDANVMLLPNTIFNTVKYFKDDAIGLVDTRMTNTGLREEGISIQESKYISREVMIKYREGLLWGAMMGPFGGCFAIRKSCYHKVPKNFFMDDFYINMKVLADGKKTINSLEAIVTEDVSNNLKEEFRRKIRISIGNFQNLSVFYPLLWPICSGRGFAFLSHKVIRWFGPLFLFLALIANIWLAMGSNFYLALLFVHFLVLVLPLFDFVSRKIGFNITLLRFTTHFYSMNLALLIGLYKFLKGVNSNVWQPTQRNQ
jgi:cellulose synthase/poly-beta-1,6-N-acetylglucosamine synthase-like glycosyltransferase